MIKSRRSLVVEPCGIVGDDACLFVGFVVLGTLGARSIIGKSDVMGTGVCQPNLLARNRTVQRPQPRGLLAHPCCVLAARFCENMHNHKLVTIYDNICILSSIHLAQLL